MEVFDQVEAKETIALIAFKYYVKVIILKLRKL